jgi:Na+:H+ antiporter
LGLPQDFPFREQIVTTTFGVVTISILGHGLTMLPLLRWLGIVQAVDERGTYDLLRGELQTAIAGLEELERLERLHSIAPGAVEQLKADYQQRIEHTRGEIGKLTVERDHLQNEEVHRVRRHLLLVEKNRLTDAYQQGLLTPAVHDRILADIDARILDLESRTDMDDVAKDKE